MRWRWTKRRASSMRWTTRRRVHAVRVGLWFMALFANAAAAGRPQRGYGTSLCSNARARGSSRPRSRSERPARSSRTETRTVAAFRRRRSRGRGSTRKDGPVVRRTNETLGRATAGAARTRSRRRRRWPRARVATRRTSDARDVRPRGRHVARPRGALHGSTPRAWSASGCASCSRPQCTAASEAAEPWRSGRAHQRSRGRGRVFAGRGRLRRGLARLRSPGVPAPATRAKVVVRDVSDVSGVGGGASRSSERAVLEARWLRALKRALRRGTRRLSRSRAQVP